MENGSSLAITLQFASTQGLEDFTVYSSHPDVADAACLYVKTDGGYFLLKQGVNGTDDYIQHTLTKASETPASLTLNFIVENGNLCYTYKFNGGETSEKMTAVEGIGTNLAWQPCFSWDVGNATEVTVTDVTFSTSSPMVPEPATATLSLLALAGLAARRRRKH
jgi:MYXO-CTERM domain-containing protein